MLINVNKLLFRDFLDFSILKFYSFTLSKKSWNCCTTTLESKQD